MTALMTHRFEARILAVFMALALVAVMSAQPAEAVKMKTIGAIAGGIAGAAVGLGAWQLAAVFMVAGALGGGVIMGLLIPAAIFLVPTIAGAIFGGKIGAWFDEKLGIGTRGIQLNKEKDF